MIQITPQMCILLAVEPVDFPRGIDGLAALCRQKLKCEPLEGAVFVFCGRRRTSLKILMYDSQGFWLCQKRLSVALKKWMEAQIEQKRVEPNSGLGQAIRYMLKRWDRLTRFLQVPGAPLDNNIVEAALKAAILHRKNSLSFKTLRGAKVGDVFMSLIHTCALNRINPFKYLMALNQNAEAVLQAPSQWFPWNYRQTLAARKPPDSG